jgi:hypothetical protein
LANHFLHSIPVRASIIACSQKKIGNLGVRPRAGDRRYACQITRVLLSTGCGCLAVVVLERLALLPGMGWGLPASPGHYLDLVSAVAGGARLLLAGVLWLVRRDGCS